MVAHTKEHSKLRVLTDDQLRIQKASSATSDLTGYEPEDLTGLHLALFTEEGQRRLLLQAGTLALLGPSQHLNVSFATATGTYMPLHTQARAVKHQGRRSILWSFTPVPSEAIPDLL